MASNPLDEPVHVVVIVELLIYIFEFVPVENTALLPLAFVEIVVLFIVAVEFSVTNTPAFTP